MANLLQLAQSLAAQNLVSRTLAAQGVGQVSQPALQQVAAPLPQPGLAGQQLLQALLQPQLLQSQLSPLQLLGQRQPQVTGVPQVPVPGAAQAALAAVPPILRATQVIQSAQAHGAVASGPLPKGMPKQRPKATPKPPAMLLAAAKVHEAGNSAESGEASPRDEAGAQDGVEDSKVRCHLHRKLNKACKFCKAFSEQQERSRELEEKRKSELLEKREAELAGLPQDDKLPVPGLSQFPQALKEKIVVTRYYGQGLADQGFNEIKEKLFNCTTCEPEVKTGSLDAFAPTPFFCCLFKLLVMKITEGQLRSMLNNRNRIVRCAAFLYVRFGLAQERYWEFLSEALLDVEEFVPWPERGEEQISEGLFVEHLLIKDKYCDLILPRISAGHRKTFNERLVLFDQFRRRYAANLEVLERFEGAGVPVEVCTTDGEWSEGVTEGPPSAGRRRVTIPVSLNDGSRQIVSLGMLICPTSGNYDPQDLTRSYGTSYQELVEKYRLQQRDAAVASGKDYCKSSGRHTVHIGGVTFVAGENKRRREEEQADREREEEEAEELRAREAKRERVTAQEHQVKQAAIMERYLGGSRALQAKQATPRDGEGPERMRLG